MPPAAVVLLCCSTIILVSFCAVPVEASSTKLRIRFPQRVHVVHRHHTLRQYARRFPYGRPLPPPPATAAAHKRRRLASRPRRRRPAPARGPYGLDYAGAYRSWTRGRRRRPQPPPLSLRGYRPDGRETYEAQELRQDPYSYQYQQHGGPHEEPSSHWEKYPPYYEEDSEERDEYPKGAYGEYDGQKAGRYPPAGRYRKRPPPHSDDGDDDGSDGGAQEGYQGYTGGRRRKRPRPHYPPPPAADEYPSASGDDRSSAAAPAHKAHHWADSQLEQHWSRQYANHRPAGEADRWSQQVGAEDRHWRPAAPAEADADADIGYGEGLQDADGTVF